jgi:hypothetical protein
MAKRALLILVCLAVLQLGSCNQPTAPPPKEAAPAAKELAGNEKPVEFITQAGTYKLFAGKVEVAVTPDDAGTGYTLKLSWRDFSATGQDHIKKGTAWFIYPESTSNLWVFTGTDLVLWEFKDKETDKKISHHATASSMITSPDIAKRVPDAVKERLPKEIKEKYLDK